MYRVFLLLLAHSHLDNAQDSSATDASKKQQSLCVLPPYPANGNYTVVNQLDARPGDGLQALYLVYSCHQGNTLIGDRDVHCINNVWTSEVPRCENEASTSTTNEKTKSSRVLTTTSSSWTFDRTEVTPQEDNSCVKDNKPGVCRLIAKCTSAKRDLAMKKTPQICSFQGLEPVVCCFDDAPPIATPTPPKDAAVTTEENSTSFDYEYPDNKAADGCEPIPPSLTRPATGRKAWDKCIEYQMKYVYPCEERLALGESKIRVNHCGHDTEELDQRGKAVKAGQFPHMVLLGYGNVTYTEWLCGGSIISEKFVLTAGHCLYSTNREEVAFVRTAVVRRSDPIDPKRLYRVARAIKHPEHRPPKKYNDIAILETDIEMLLDRLAMPICLPVGDSYNDTRAMAIGFGTNGLRGNVSDRLQTVTLNKFSSEDCSKSNPPFRLLDKGIQEDIQTCYGDKVKARDTCQGDSGGPLHIYNKDIHCMYTIVGITSFGRGCGFVGVPGVYTRVAAYIPWIEREVWPN